MVRQNGSGQEAEISYRAAGKQDLPAIGRIYLRAFPGSIQELRSPNLQPQAVADLLAAVQDADPEAITVAQTAAGDLIGYIAAPTNICQVSRAALRPRRAPVLLWRLLTGRYRLSGRGLLTLILDRVHLRRSEPKADCSARVLSLAVDPQWQRRQVGRGLMQAALRRFRARGIDRVRLEVRPGNTAACRLYASLGFVVVGESRDSRGPWLVMTASTAGESRDDAA